MPVWGWKGVVLALGAGTALFLASRLSGKERPAPRAESRAAESPLFADVTERSGIRFAYLSRPQNIKQSVGAGVGLLDADGDGRLDVFLIGQRETTPTGGGALWRQTSAGTFEDVTRASGLGVPGEWSGCAVGDVNNDGRPDLVLTGFGDCRLFLNQGGCRFQDATASSGLKRPGPRDWTTAAAFGDVNRDGAVDLVIGRYILYERLDRSIKWWAPENYRAQFPTFYLNDGHGHFRDATREYHLTGNGKTLGAQFADVNDDGFPDLYLANDETPCDLFVNHQGRHLENRGVLSGTAYNFNGQVQAGMGVDWGDVDEDRLPDLAVTTFAREPLSLYLNEGRGFFQHASIKAGLAGPTTPYIGWGVKLLDYDLDGHLDLVTVNGHVRADASTAADGAVFEQPPQLFRGTGQGHFELIPERRANLGPPLAARGLAAGDVDNDGRPDLLVGNINGSPRLLHNTGAGANWIGFDLVGKSSNRMAVGARIRVRGLGREQLREISTGGSYLSANDPRALFGLGTATGADEVEIVWPNGRAQRLRNLKAGRYYRYVEP